MKASFPLALSLSLSLFAIPHITLTKMGRTTKWLKTLFGIKKDKEQKENSNSGEQNDKNRWSLGHSGKDSSGSGQNPETIPPNIMEAKKLQRKQAMEVAAATSAAADAAIAAAKAVVAAVRLTSSHGRATMFGGGSRERWAALKIQSVFRGYLARRALKALKGLVKIQAHVRGYLVRKQATAMFRSMLALIRAQATVRAQKSLGFINTGDNFHPHFRIPKSIERFDETRSEYNNATIRSRRHPAFFETRTNAIHKTPKIVEVDKGRFKSRSQRFTTSVSDFGNDPRRVLTHLSIPECRSFHCAADWGFATTQNTPRVVNWSGPPTPADDIFRSTSAPKQRPELCPKKKLSLNQMMEARKNRLSEARIQRSSSEIQEMINFKKAVIGKLDRSSEFIREKEQDHYTKRRW
ncbi:unnamed protein product [Camellia sinensis]